MADWRFVDFQVPEAQRLADLTGVSYDLGMVTDICHTYLNYKERGDIADLWQKQSLCMTAVTMYMRTATSGVRAGVTAEHLAKLNDTQQTQHSHFKNLRDKWVAHSVNAFEETNVVVYLTPIERGPRGISQVQAQHRFTCTLSYVEAISLTELAQALKVIIDAEIFQEKDRLLRYANSLPVDEFYDNPDAYKLQGQNRDPGSPRKRYGSSS